MAKGLETEEFESLMNLANIMKNTDMQTSIFNSLWTKLKASIFAYHDLPLENEVRQSVKKLLKSG
eukprot:UN03356